jgi:hypothetical protein
MTDSKRTTYNIACVKVNATPDDGKPIAYRLEPITERNPADDDNQKTNNK